jgi:DNA-binding MarR family transcriptional regulator
MENKYTSLVRKTIYVNKLHRRAIEAKVSEIGIHRSQHFILMRLAREESFKSQRAFAESLGITPAAMTLALDKLEQNGFIKRKVGSDGRFNIIEITSEGREVVERSEAMFSVIDKAMFCGFSEEEIEKYTSFIERIEKNLQEYIDAED